MFPMSSVGLTKTLAPAPLPVDAMVRTPTEDSGFCCILAPTTKFAASCWLSCLVGVKSPLRMNSLVSRHIIVLSRGMVAVRARRLVGRAAAAFLVSGSLWGPRRAAPARARQSWRGAGIARSQTLYRRARSPYRGAVRVLYRRASKLVCYYAGETDNLAAV